MDRELGGWGISEERRPYFHLLCLLTFDPWVYISILKTEHIGIKNKVNFVSHK